MTEDLSISKRISAELEKSRQERKGKSDEKIVLAAKYLDSGCDKDDK